MYKIKMHINKLLFMFKIKRSRGNDKIKKKTKKNKRTKINNQKLKNY